MFHIRPLPLRNRIFVEFDEQFDHDPREVLYQLKRAASRVRREDGSFDLICDWSRAQIMPETHAQVGQRAVAWCLANGLRKSANILPDATQRMQFKQVSASHPHFDHFSTLAEAEHWLDD